MNNKILQKLMAFFVRNFVLNILMHHCAIKGCIYHTNVYRLCGLYIYFNRSETVVYLCNISIALCAYIHAFLFITE